MRNKCQKKCEESNKELEVMMRYEQWAMAKDPMQQLSVEDKGIRTTNE